MSSACKANKGAIPDGTGARVAMFSARFDGGEVEHMFRRIHRKLEGRGYKIFMVEADAGEDFGRKTSAFLGQLKKQKGVLLAVCTDHYAEITRSPYSSYEELRFCYNNRIGILPLRLCEEWPPDPPSGPEHPYDKDGEACGLLSLAMPDNVVFVECRSRSEDDIAMDIAEHLHRGGLTSGHGKEANGYVTNATCQKADQKSAKAWYNLGAAGGGTVGGVEFDKKSCYGKALDIDPKYAAAWFNLGVVGGGTVGGVEFDKKSCYGKALDIDPKYAAAWFNLGVVGGGTVEGVPRDKKSCFVKALEVDLEYAAAWRSLGLLGGGTLGGVTFDKKSCYAKALELDPKHTLAQVDDESF